MGNKKKTDTLRRNRFLIEGIRFKNIGNVVANNGVISRRAINMFQRRDISNVILPPSENSGSGKSNIWRSTIATNRTQKYSRNRVKVSLKKSRFKNLIRISKKIIALRPTVPALRRLGIRIPLLGLGRNFLVHGQSTTAWSELQLLKKSNLSPGWRKATVRRRLSLLYFPNSYLLLVVLPCSFYAYKFFIWNASNVSCTFVVWIGSSVIKSTREIIFCKCILLVLKRYQTPHLYKPAYLVGCVNNWEYIIARDT